MLAEMIVELSCRPISSMFNLMRPYWFELEDEPIFMTVLVPMLVFFRAFEESINVSSIVETPNPRS